MTRLLIGAALLGLSGCKPSSKPSTTSVSESKVDFNRDIQPLLAGHCYHCHGPDPGSRKSGLRLDRAETAFAKRIGRPDAIVKGKPDASELIRRVSAHDGAVMPPRGAVEKPLAPEQIATLRRWIEQGAEYRPHWAFEPPVRPSPPEVPGAGPNPIDRFVLQKLAEVGLKPNPPADRVTLIRRATLDLTGLLPTPAEVDAFVNDRAPDAYGKVVDRLLASTAFGEQRARYWLDGARYGDTHGLHSDNPRSIWPYRDYVIRSFNQNKPFDRFVTEQLAGDMGYPKDIDAIVATGFIRAGISTGEGGTIIEELAVNLKRERTEAYGAMFLGLTVGCASCHDHKFDPTTQKDFYALTAFFNNLAEKPSHDERADWPPNVRVPKPEKLADYNAALAEKADILRQIGERRDRARELIAKWIAGTPGVKPVSETGLKLRLRLDENAGVALANSAPNADPKVVNATGGNPLWGEDTLFWPSLRMDSTTRIELPSVGDFDTADAFSAGTWVTPRLEAFAGQSMRAGSILSRMEGDGDGRGWDLFFENGKVAVNLVAKRPGDAIKVVTKDAVLKHGRWDHVFMTYDGSGKASGVKIFINGTARQTAVLNDSLKGTIRTKAPFLVAQRAPKKNPFREARYQDLRVYARNLPPEEAARVAYEDRVAEILPKPAKDWSDDELKAVSDFYFANADAPMRELVAKLPAADAKLGELSKDGAVTLVCKERPDLAYADVLSRGAYSDRIGRVRPAVPGFLPGPPKDASPDRRMLAAWTMSAENPLTARVTVNRLWGEIFGAGIVETTEDFGIMGDRPVNPALLDWLAVEFRESGWDYKHMCRLMVTSDAYARSSQATPETREKDPGNRLLARGPRYRMDAEMLRDTALQASGLLSPKIGGPSVKPYQPEGVWEAVSNTSSRTYRYARDSGESLYRRSLYSYWKRQAISPQLETFDAPVRDASCTRRPRTNTPLQALVTMNDPQWIEAARFLAERALREGGATTDSRFDFLGRVLFGEKPSGEIREALAESLPYYKNHYTAAPDKADVLLSTGDKPRDPALDRTELAAWTLVASEMLNLDMTLNK